MENRLDLADSNTTIIHKLNSFHYENAPIIIVGGGPSGLATALNLLQKKYEIILINYYPYRVRTQNVLIKDQMVRENLLSFVDPNNELDMIFKNKLVNNNYIISIRAIEKFLLRKLNELSYKEDKCTYIDNRFGKITAINTAKTQIVLTLSDKNKSPIIVPFKHLVDASGVNRIAFTLANLSSAAISESLGRLRHEAQGTALFHLDKDTINKKYPKLQVKQGSTYKLYFTEQEIENLRLQFGWNHQGPPEIYIFANKGHDKLYVGGEIPGYYTKIKILDQNKMFDKTKQDEIRRIKTENWFKFMISTKLSIDAEDLYIKADGKLRSASYLALKEKFIQKDGFNEHLAEEAAKKTYQLSVTHFDLRMSRIKNPVQDLSGNGNHWLVAIGDALQNAHFHLSHGISDGIYAALMFTNCLSQKGPMVVFHVAKFLKFIEELRTLHQHTIFSMIGKFFIPINTRYALDDFIMKEADEKIDLILLKQPKEVNEEDRLIIQSYKEQITERMNQNNPTEETRLLHLLTRCNDTLTYIADVLNGPSNLSNRSGYTAV